MWPSSGEEGLDVGQNVGSAVKGGRNGLCIHRISMVRRWGEVTRRKRTGRGGGGGDYFSPCTLEIGVLITEVSMALVPD